MPGGSGNGMFFSFNVGPVHFVSFSSEYYYYTNYGTKQIAVQYKWLEKDLKVRNIPNNILFCFLRSISWKYSQLTFPLPCPCDGRTSSVVRGTICEYNFKWYFEIHIINVLNECFKKVTYLICKVYAICSVKVASYSTQEHVSLNL